MNTVETKERRPWWGSPGVQRVIVAAVGPMVVVWGIVAVAVMLGAFLVCDSLFEPYWTEAWKSPMVTKGGRSKVAAGSGKEV
jgi:hypothetical protein